jgi:hypothetical protein
MPETALKTTGTVVVHRSGDACGGERIAVIPAGYRLPVRRLGYGSRCLFYEVSLPGGGRGFVYGDAPVEVERLLAMRQKN